MTEPSNLISYDRNQETQREGSGNRKRDPSLLGQPDVELQGIISISEEESRSQQKLEHPARDRVPEETGELRHQRAQPVALKKVMGLIYLSASGFLV